MRDRKLETAKLVGMNIQTRLFNPRMTAFLAERHWPGAYNTPQTNSQKSQSNDHSKTG